MQTIDSDGPVTLGKTAIDGASAAYDGDLAYSDRSGIVRMPDGTLGHVILGLFDEETGAIQARVGRFYRFGKVTVVNGEFAYADDPEF
jgi:hypothetical protein